MNKLIRILSLFTVFTYSNGFLCPNVVENGCEGTNTCPGLCYRDVEGYDDRIVCCSGLSEMCRYTGLLSFHSKETISGRDTYLGGTVGGSIDRFYEKDTVTSVVCPKPYSYASMRLPIESLPIRIKDLKIWKHCEYNKDCGEDEFCGPSINPSFFEFNKDGVRMEETLDRSNNNQPIHFCYSINFDRYFFGSNKSVTNFEVDSKDLKFCDTDAECGGGGFFCQRVGEGLLTANISKTDKLIEPRLVAGFCAVDVEKHMCPDGVTLSLTEPKCDSSNTCSHNTSGVCFNGSCCPGLQIENNIPYLADNLYVTNMQCNPNRPLPSRFQFSFCWPEKGRIVVIGKYDEAGQKFTRSTSVPCKNHTDCQQLGGAYCVNQLNAMPAICYPDPFAPAKNIIFNLIVKSILVVIAVTMFIFNNLLIYYVSRSYDSYAQSIRSSPIEGPNN